MRRSIGIMLVIYGFLIIGASVCAIFMINNPWLDWTYIIWTGIGIVSGTLIMLLGLVIYTLSEEEAKSSKPHEHRIAYALWGIAWWMVGVYDALFWNRWIEKYFATVFTLAIFSIWVGYELSYIRFIDPKRTILYFTMYIFGINNWNVAWAVFAYMFMGWRPSRNIWLAPGIIVPIEFYYLMTISGFLTWLIYGLLLNLKKEIVEVYKLTCG